VPIHLKHPAPQPPTASQQVAEMSFGVPAGMARQSELNLRVDVTDALAAISARTLVIGCTRDQMVPVEHARALHAAIAGSAYVEFDTGHLVIYEQPDALCDAIEDFIGAEQAEAAA
jgi:pimeloyl-ACP methyl ester carboxylesterase